MGQGSSDLQDFRDRLLNGNIHADDINSWKGIWEGPLDNAGVWDSLPLAFLRQLKHARPYNYAAMLNQV